MQLTMSFSGSHPNFWHGGQRAFLRAFPRLFPWVSDPSTPLQRRENQKHEEPEPRRFELTSHVLREQCCLLFLVNSEVSTSVFLPQTSISWSPSAAWWSAPRSSSLRCRRHSSSARCAPTAPAWRWIAGASPSRLCVATATPPTAWRWFTIAPSSQTNRWWEFAHSQRHLISEYTGGNRRCVAAEVMATVCLPFFLSQQIKIQESPEDMPAGQTPHTTIVYAHNDLVDKVQPGDRVNITGEISLISW